MDYVIIYRYKDSSDRGAFAYFTHAASREEALSRFEGDITASDIDVLSMSEGSYDTGKKNGRRLGILLKVADRPTTRFMPTNTTWKP